MGKGLLALLIIGGTITVVSAIIILIVIYYNKVLKKTYEKVSDAELIRLIGQLGAVDSKQIAARTSLTKSEVSMRLNSLSMYSAVQTLYNSMGSALYQVKGNIPDINQIYNIEGLSPQETVQIIVNATGESEITLAQLMVVFDLPLKEAYKKLKELVKQGVLSVSYSSSWRKVYTATNIQPNTIHTQQPNNQNQNPPITVHQLAAPKEEERLRIPDADVLQLAIDNDGRITPILLCAEKRISLKEAKEALDDLYDHGAFTIDVDEDSGSIEYWLRDKKLIKKKG